MSEVISKIHEAAKELEKFRAIIREVKEELLGDVRTNKLVVADLAVVRELIETDRIEAKILAEDFRELHNLALKQNT